MNTLVKTKNIIFISFQALHKTVIKFLHFSMKYITVLFNVLYENSQQISLFSMKFTNGQIPGGCPSFHPLVSIKNITVIGPVHVPLRKEMFGSILVKDVPTNCILFGRLLNIWGQKLQTFSSSSSHGQHLGHTGSLQVIQLEH